MQDAEKVFGTLTATGAATATDACYAMLRESIVSGALAPGTRLRSGVLAKQMRVSRTPVREALHKLETEGFVVVSGRSGLIVSPLSDRILTEVFQVREVLEGLAARLAAENATPVRVAKIREAIEDFKIAIASGDVQKWLVSVCELQEAIANASDNSILIGYLRALRDRSLQFRIRTLRRKERAKAILEEYQNVLSAIEARDAVAAEMAARAHRRNALIAGRAMLRAEGRNVATPEPTGTAKGSVRYDELAG